MKIHKVLVDTNALIYAVQKKRDMHEDLQKWLGNFELIILLAVKKELEKMAEKAKKLKRTRSPAKIALQLLKKATIVEYGKAGGKTDDLILEYAKEYDAQVLTNDIALKKKLKKEHVKVIPPEVFIRKAGK